MAQYSVGIPQQKVSNVVLLRTIKVIAQNRHGPWPALFQIKHSCCPMVSETGRQASYSYLVVIVPQVARSPSPLHLLGDHSSQQMAIARKKEEA